MTTLAGLKNTYSDNVIVNPEFDGLNGWDVTGEVAQFNTGFVKVGTDSLLKQTFQVPATGEDTAYQDIYGFRFSVEVMIPLETTSDDTLGSVTGRLVYDDGTSKAITALATKLHSGYHTRFDMPAIASSYDIGVEGEAAPQYFEIIIEGYSECYFGNIELVMNYGVIIEEIDEDLFKPAPNMLRNSSFELVEEGFAIGWQGLAFIEEGGFEGERYGIRAVTLGGEGDFIETETSSFMYHENRPIVVSFYHNGLGGNVEIIAPSGDVIKSVDIKGHVSPTLTRSYFVINPIDFGTVSAFGIRFRPLLSLRIDNIKVEAAVDAEGNPLWNPAPTDWVPHVDDEQYVASWVTRLRIGKYNILENSRIVEPNTLSLYSMAQLVDNTTAVAKYEGDDSYVGLHCTLAPDKTNYNVYFIEYDTIRMEVVGYTQVDTPVDPYVTAPYGPSIASIILITEVDYNDFNPLQHEHQAYAVRYDAGELPPSSYLYYFEVGDIDCMKFDLKDNSGSIRDYILNKNDTLHTSYTHYTEDRLAGISADLASRIDDMELYIAVADGDGVNIDRYYDSYYEDLELLTGTEYGRSVDVFVIVSKGPLTADSIVWATGVTFITGQGQGTDPGDTGDVYRLEFGMSALHPSVTFEFDHSPGYDVVESITTGIVSSTPTNIKLSAKPIQSGDKYVAVEVLAEWDGEIDLEAYKVSIQAVCLIKEEEDIVIH